MGVFSAGVHRVLMTIALAVSLTNGRQILFQIESCRVIYEININFSTICCTTAAACPLDLQRFTAALQSVLALSLSHTHSPSLFCSLSVAMLCMQNAKISLVCRSFLLMLWLSLRQTEWECVCVCKYDLASCVCVCCGYGPQCDSICILCAKYTNNSRTFPIGFYLFGDSCLKFTLHSPISSQPDNVTPLQHTLFAYGKLDLTFWCWQTFYVQHEALETYVGLPWYQNLTKQYLKLFE